MADRRRGLGPGGPSARERSADLFLDEVRHLVVSSFRSFFENEVPPERVRKADETAGFDRALWDELAGLGGCRVCLPEAAGGAGGDLLDAVLVAIEAGRRLAPVPYAEAVSALRLGHALGFAPDDLPGGPDAVSIVVAPEWAGGESVTVLSPAGAVAASAIVITGDRASLVALDDAVQREPVANLGNLPMARLAFSRLRPVATAPADPQALRDWRADRRLLYASLLVGAGQQAFDLAHEHVRQRVQFDRPIGSFQAIQHRLADRVTALEGAELLVVRGASHDPGDHVERTYLSAVALAATREAGELAAKEAVQLFGGYGVSLEYDIHLYLRFVKATGVVSGDPHAVADALPASARDETRTAHETGEWSS